LSHILTTAAGVRTPVAAEQLAETVDGVGRAAVVGVGPAGTQAAVAIIETVPAASTPALASPKLAGEVRTAVVAGTAAGARTAAGSAARAGTPGSAAAAAYPGAGMDLAAVLIIPSMPTDIRHNSKIDRTALAAWATTALSGGKMRRP
ncbi:MAG: hypothetical protein M3021_09900, partial [Actinomycetota bacterium]|nr:hypothetical protein [Actinomycetota bacterium]